MAELKFFLFGLPRLERRGRAVAVHRRKSLALAAYLAVTCKPHDRETLAALFWPDQNQKRAQASLRTTLWQLNKTFGPDWLESGRDRIELDRKKSDAVDVNRFQGCLAKCAAHQHPDGQVGRSCLTSLNQAVEIYRDDFMAGFSLPDSLLFEQWKRSQVQRLSRDLTKALEKLIQFHVCRQEYEQALAYADRRLQVDPSSEAAHGHLMKLYAWLGRPTDALRHYKECSEILAGEFDIKPDKNLTKLYLEIKNKRFPGPRFMRQKGHCPLADKRGLGRSSKLSKTKPLTVYDEHRKRSGAL